jgi:hypothetical protein
MDAPVAKLLGTYEQELHAAFRDAIEKPPRAFIDLGAAEGYYAVGFARACPSTEVYAFELAGSARRACELLAANNDVEMTIAGKATSRRLCRLPLEGSLVLCDIEGAEARIFDSPTVGALRATTVIVELHEHLAPGITELLRSRFATHDLRLLSIGPRDVNGLVELRDFSPREQHLFIDEERWRAHPISWAIFRPS